MWPCARLFLSLSLCFPICHVGWVVMKSTWRVVQNRLLGTCWHFPSRPLDPVEEVSFSLLIQKAMPSAVRQATSANQLGRALTFP